jgi:hypothetical protein
MDTVDGHIQVQQVLFEIFVLVAGVLKQDRGLFDGHKVTDAVYESAAAFSWLLKGERRTACKTLMALEQRAGEKASHVPQLAHIDSHVERFMSQLRDGNQIWMRRRPPSHKAVLHCVNMIARTAGG